MDEPIAVTKHWFRVNETTWQLLVEVDGRIFTKTVIIYDTTGDYSGQLETNKKLKEFDLIEQAWKELGVKLRLV